jgi:hypothetical protein
MPKEKSESQWPKEKMLRCSENVNQNAVYLYIISYRHFVLAAAILKMAEIAMANDDFRNNII